MQTFLSLFCWHGLQGKVVSRFKDAKWIVGSAQHTLLIIFNQTNWQNVHWILKEKKQCMTWKFPFFVGQFLCLHTFKVKH